MNEATTEAMTIGERIKEALEFKTVFTFHIGNFTIPVSETVVTTWIIMAILIVGAFLLTRRLRTIPEGPQVFLEAFIGFLNKFFKDNLGHYSKVFGPYLGTVALYLATANAISFFSPISGFGFEAPFVMKPPTRDINVTAALAIMTIVITLVSGIMIKGFGKWCKGLAKPSPVMLPFNLLEYIIRPMSLCLRLYGNILGAFIIMELVGMMIPVIVPPILSLYFDFFDGLIQAVVFIFLSTLYIGEAVE